MRAFLLLLALVAGPVAAAYDANGVPLGASENEVKKRFPSAFCKPLPWSSPAADRRCDDARASIGGVEGRLTFYLKNDAVQAFDLRFSTSDLKRLMGALTSRYGKPSSEGKDVFERSGKSGREIYKALWESGRDRALLVAPLEKKRSQLTVSRGSFEEDIYKPR